jgi:hypothetical protein
MFVLKDTIMQLLHSSFGMCFFSLFEPFMLFYISGKANLGILSTNAHL